jgi:hypothetical protein|nr:MAG TPA: DNA polymerase II small subunit [Caudoviricetes sp.]
MFDVRRRSDELLDEQYLYRIGKAKDDGLITYTWDELAPVLNEECDVERVAGSWRQIYALGKKWQAVFQKCGVAQDNKQEVVIERMKLRDERTALNKELRSQARYEANNELWEQRLAEIGSVKYPVATVPQIDGNCDLLVCLSDWHIGMRFDSYIGKYDSDIAQARLSQFLGYIQDIQKRHNAANAHVAILGDLISGKPHSVVAIENREDVVDQVILAGEMLSCFLYELSLMFTYVDVASVAGNHSRLTQNKKEAVLGERLDKLVVWHAKSELKHCANIRFPPLSTPFQGTIELLDVRGKNYVLNHGDFDTFSEAGAAKLFSFLGFVPSGIITAHKHTPAYMTVNSVTCIQNGCLSGGGDQFTLEHRLGGKPSQTVCVCSDNGIDAMYPVRLT